MRPRMLICNHGKGSEGDCKNEECPHYDKHTEKDVCCSPLECEPAHEKAVCVEAEEE